MLRTLAIAGALALLTAATASAAGNATASLTSPTAAQHSGLTLVLRPAVLRCGRLGARALTITLPQAMRVPASIPRDAVRVGGRAVAAVRTDGKTVVLSLQSPHGVSCDSIVVGSLRVELTRAAGLVNPSRAGSYAFGVAAAPRGAVWHGSFVVHS